MTTKSIPSPGYEDRRNRARHRYAMCKGAAKPKRPSVRTMIKNAEKDGKKVSGATVAADGSVTLQFGEADNGGDHAANEWDEVLPDGAASKIH
jgi:hypothetical protein